MNQFLAFAAALLLTALFTPAVIWTARRRGWVAAPRKDRWHKKPTAIYGGVAIFLGFIVPLLWLAPPSTGPQWALAICASAMFLVGLFDDIREMKPQLKFLFQVLVALVAVFMGIRLDFIPYPWLAMPLTVFWLVGVTNAVNILDNMDGLSAGVTLMAGVVMAVEGYLTGRVHPGLAAALLAGSSLGFLIYNFNPAKIFMGDCGSLFLGFTLASVAVLGSQAAAEGLTLDILVPLGALVVPLFDTTLVALQRTSHGRSIAQGGRDHSSHRLVFLGQSERRAVLILLGISLLSGMGVLYLVHQTDPLTALVVLALALVFLVFFGIFLAGVKVYDAGAKPSERWKHLAPPGVVRNRKQILMIITDTVLFSAAYMGAYLLRFGGDILPGDLDLMTQSLPLVVGVKLICLWFFGAYRGDWRYVSIEDMMRLGKALILASFIIVLALVLIYRFMWYSRAALVLDAILGFMCAGGSRVLIRVFRESLAKSGDVPVLIVGAGNGGELLLRELKTNPKLPYRAVGFVDDDPGKRHLEIHGVGVLGRGEDLSRLVEEHHVERVFISILSEPDRKFEDIFAKCRELGVECTRIQPMIRLD